jgi:hypothetical protein
MKGIINSWRMLIFIGLALCLGLFLLLRKANLSQAHSIFMLQGINAMKQNPTNKPCANKAMKNPETQEEWAAYDVKMQRETYGHPQDMPLEEAIKIFNQEAGCNEIGRTQPPLTMDEIIAAAIDLDKSGEMVSKSRSEALRKISREKIMPKGSLLVYKSGHHQDDVLDPSKYIHVKYWKVYLYIGLDKNPRESKPLESDQIGLIREHYYGAEYISIKDP